MGIIRMAIYIYALGISLFYAWYNNNGRIYIVVIWQYNGDMGKKYGMAWEYSAYAINIH